MKLTQSTLFLGLILCFVLAACRGATEEAVQVQPASLKAVTLAEGQPLKVVATTTIIGDLVRNVGGEAIALTVLLPIGADTHTFNPTPQDAAAVAEADVVFVNGLGLEAFLTELIEQVGGQAKVVTVTTGVETRDFEAMAEDTENHAEGEEAHEAENHSQAGADPHVWMTPTNAAVMVHNIEAALSALDPARAETYMANADRYADQLAELDTWVMAQFEAVPAENRKIVTDHDSFGYYAERYGLEIIGAVIPAYSSGAEPSAQELANLEDAIRAFGVKAIFVGTTVNPVLANRVAADLGIQLTPLYTESLGGPGSGAETYLDYMHYNTTAIVRALK